MAAERESFEPLNAKYFEIKYHWGENWLQDHQQVVRFQSMDQITGHYVFSLQSILNVSSKTVHGKSLSMDKFLQFLALILPPGKRITINSKKLRRIFDGRFNIAVQTRDKRGTCNKFVCYVEVKDVPFFDSQAVSDEGEMLDERPAGHVEVDEIDSELDERHAIVEHSAEPEQAEIGSVGEVTTPQTPSAYALLLKRKVLELEAECKLLRGQLQEQKEMGSIDDLLFDNKDAKIFSLERQLNQMREDHSAEISRLNKHHAGLHSGIKRKLTYDQAEQQQVYADRILDGDPFVHIIERMNEGDDNDEDSPRIFKGKEYKGVDMIGNTSVKESFYVRIASPGGTSRKLNSEITAKAVAARARLALLFLGLLSGISWEKVSGGQIDGLELFPLLIRVINTNKAMFLAVLADLGHTLMRKMTVSQAVDLKVLLNLPMATFRRMRIILKNFGLSIFPSENKMREEVEGRVRYLKDAELKSEKMALEVADGEVKMTEVLYSNNLSGYLKAAYSKLDSSFYDGKDLIWVVIHGDKGGKHMKFNFQIAYPESSVRDVHVFSFYEGGDRPQCMRQVLTKFDDAFAELGSPDFRLDGRKVEFLLGGDYRFQDGIEGISGSTGTYPCGKCLVTLKHLREHGGKKADQTCKECNCSAREDSDLEELYNANVAVLSGEGRNAGKLATSKQGKDHAGVKERRLIDFIPLKNIVPPVLHITLGIVKRMFEKKLELCRKADATDVEAIRAVEEEWEVVTAELIAKEAEVSGLAQDYLDIANWGERLCCETQEEIDDVALRSDSAKLRKEKEPSCSSKKCVISEYDYNRFWVHCDDCHNDHGLAPLGDFGEVCSNSGCWYHQLCEGVLSSENARVEAQPLYSCLKHSEDISDVDSLKNIKESRLDILRTRQKVIEAEYYSLRTECIVLKNKVDKMVGPFETELLSVLDDMNVDRQAYHSNAFVGNHCKIILEKRAMFSDVLNKVDVDFCKKMLEVMEEFSEAHHLMTAKKLLNAKDQCLLKQHCQNFGRLYPIYFPEDPCLTRKIHALTVHVSEFVEEHGAIGLFSEEDGESLHKIVNQKLRQYSNVRASSARNELIHKDLELSSVTSRESLKPDQRKCDCGSFFVANQCKTCGQAKQL